MGKKGKRTENNSVKQEVVSMASLEVVSEEKFQKRLEGMSSCLDCLKIRTKADIVSSTNKTFKRRRCKSKGKGACSRSAPTVVHLEDSLKLGGGVKNKTLPTSASQDHLIKCSNTNQCSSDISGLDDRDNNLFTSKSTPASVCNSKETVVSLNNTHYYSGSLSHHHHHHHHHRSPKHHRSCHRMSCTNKNFNAFLSAIERVHLKDPKSTSTKLENLVEYAHDKKDKLYLNNALNYCQNKVSSSGRTSPHTSHLHLLSDKNVQLICNNLSHSSSMTDAEDTSNGSSISSASSSGSEDNENESESSSCDYSASSDELSNDELNYLSQYVCGYSLTKYDCAPDECPQCLTAYYDFLSQCAPSFNLDQSATSSSDDSDTDSSEDQLSANYSCVTIKSLGKVEVSVANLFKNHKRKRSRKQSKCPPVNTNGIYVDLEDAEVSLSIEYHPETVANESKQSHQHSHSYSHHYHEHNPDAGLHPHQHTSTSVPIPSFWDWFYFPLGMYGWLPYSLPYCLVPMYYLPYPLYATIPKPLCVPRNTPCLNSQRLCMVPAQEIKNFTASQPPQRPWIPLSHPERNRPIALYTVMCYNVLCDKYATRQLYGYCPSWALNWEYRKKGIIEEIRHYSADIISLQEVETDQFYNFFLPELKRDGYDGIFSPKSRARTMTESERKHVDGCAIFYRTAKFSLIKEHLVEFNQLAMTTADGSHDMLNRVMTKDNIGLAALFETKEAIWENGLPPDGQVNQPILVATCHVHWDPEFSDVKLIQTMMLMSELKNILDETQTSFRPGSTTAPDVNNIPFILCGDLNSLPNSGVLEFLTTSRVAATHEDFKDLGYDACLQKLTTSDHKDVYTHSFKLAPAYSKDIMPYTNYTYDFKGVIDYIFYSRELMRPLGVLGPLDENWFTENKVLGCPHPHVPSDHLPLLVELEMQLPSTAQSSNQRSNSIHIPNSVRR